MDKVDFKALIPEFQDALCPGELGFTPDGYLTTCFTNTYIFTPVALALALWGIKDTKDLNTNGHAANSRTGRINFAFTCLYAVTIFNYGPKIFNVIALVASMVTLMIVFILSFMDLKGVNVPNKPLEIYFFLVAAVSGYYVVMFIGTKSFGKALNSSVWVCLVSSLAGSARNIISAFDDAQIQAAKSQKIKSE